MKERNYKRQYLRTNVFEKNQTTVIVEKYNEFKCIVNTRLYYLLKMLKARLTGSNVILSYLEDLELEQLLEWHLLLQAVQCHQWE